MRFGKIVVVTMVNRCFPVVQTSWNMMAIVLSNWVTLANIVVMKHDLG